MAPQLARRLLYAIAAVGVISTAAIALVRPAPPPAPRSAPVSQPQVFLPIAGSVSVIDRGISSSSLHNSYVFTLNGNPESFSLQKLCGLSNVPCTKVVFRTAPP